MKKKIIDRITKGRIIRHIWTLFETKEEKREWMKSEKKKKKLMRD